MRASDSPTGITGGGLPPRPGPDRMGKRGFWGDVRLATLSQAPRVALAGLVEQLHTLAFCVIDDGAGRAFMVAIVDADGTVLARTGGGQFRVTLVDLPVDWVLPEFDDSSWSVATPFSYVAGEWETPGKGFRSISDPYGAARMWEGDTCSDSGGASLWIRALF